MLSGTYPNPGLATSVAIPGAPTTTTPAAGDSSTKVATTAFVQNAIGPRYLASMVLTDPGGGGGSVITPTGEKNTFAQTMTITYLSTGTGRVTASAAAFDASNTFALIANNDLDNLRHVAIAIRSSTQVEFTVRDNKGDPIDDTPITISIAKTS